MRRPSFPVNQLPSRLSTLALSLLLVACGQQRIRDETTAQLREGNYEGAIAGLQSGIAQYPESATLRAGLSSTKSEAIAKLVAQAAQQRAEGKFDDADKTIQRGLKLDPKNSRLLTLQSDLALVRKQSARMEDINKLLQAGNKDKALRLVELALRDSPRQPDFLALQRRLELELRFDSGASGTRTLAESRPISLDFRNTPLSTVLDAITRGSGINFVLDREVRQDSRVTVYLRNAKIDDAIDLVLSAGQLARRTMDTNTVLIYPNTPEKLREHQEQVIRVFHLANADAKSTAGFLKAMLRIKDPFVDERSNLISIRETPEIVALAERLVALHDVGEAEVMMEVEILEVKTSRLTELGINFPNSLTLTPLPAAGQTGLNLGSLATLNNDRIGVSVASILINLRREVGDFNILANPRIRAKNREKAHILIGDRVPVITSTSSATGFVGESVSYLDVGLKLDVEPTVSPDDEVTIKLGLEVSSLAKEVRTTGGSLAYQIGTRNANTVLRLRDGETQLLAGLISNEDRSTSNRVPGLGDLPIAGRLFSSQKDDVQRTELVLAITPRIVRSAPRPDIAQAELWVGSELSTKLRSAPWQRSANIDGNAASATTGANSAATNTAANANPALAGNTPTDAPKGPPRLQWKAPSEVKVGETFTAELHLSSATAFRGAPIDLSIPNTSLEIMEVGEGSFFQLNDGTTSFTHAFNPSTAKLSTMVLRSDSTGASGQGSVLRLKLKALTAGSNTVTVSSFRPMVLAGESPSLELPALTITAKP